MAQKCYVHVMFPLVLKKKKSLSIQMEEDQREEQNRSQPVEGLKKNEVDWLEKMLQIGAMLP